MAEETLAVNAALRTISQASQHALASCSLELHEANLVIAKALLTLSESYKDYGYATKSSLQRCATGESFSAKLTTLEGQHESRNALEKETTWLSKPDNALVNVAQYWLQTRAMAPEHRSRRDDLPLIVRRAVISNSPAVLALLRKLFIKRSRLAKFK